MKTPLHPVLLLAALAAVAPGCSASEEDEVKVSCDEHAKVGGECPGVTSAAVSTAGLSCTSTIEAGSQADLDAKLGSAAAGSCVVLGGGAFGVIKLVGGVHLVGKGAGSTKVDGVTFTGAAGAASTIRGISVGKAGVVATGGGSLTIEHARVSGATGVGVSAQDVNLTIRTSTIDANGDFGVEAISLQTITPRVTLSLHRVLVRENHRMGVLAQNVDVTLEGVQVDGTKQKDFQFGRGIEVAYGGSLVAKNVAIVKNPDVGIFVEGGSADLQNFAASGNFRGVQLQAVKGGKLENFDIEGNTALGIGITKGAEGIVVQGGRVASTKMQDVPVDIGGIDAVGDGVNWLDGSEVSISSTVKIESSARRPVIISANSRGSFEGTLAGGDETQGIVVQGGLEAAMPDTLNIAGSVKSSVLTKDQAMPVAVAVAAAVKKAR